MHIQDKRKTSVYYHRERRHVVLSNTVIKDGSMTQAWSFFVQHAGVDQGHVQRILTSIIVFQRVHFITVDL